VAALVKRLGQLDAGVEPPRGCPPRPPSLSLGARLHLANVAFRLQRRLLMFSVYARNKTPEKDAF
jgi:hypothetical protein